MGTLVRLDDSDKSDIIKYHDKMSSKELAAYIGCHTQTIVRYKRKWNLSSQPTKWTYNNRVTLAMYVDMKVPHKEIAEIFGTTKKAIGTQITLIRKKGFTKTRYKND